MFTEDTFSLVAHCPPLERQLAWFQSKPTSHIKTKYSLWRKSVPKDGDCSRKYGCCSARGEVWISNCLPFCAAELCILQSSIEGILHYLVLDRPVYTTHFLKAFCYVNDVKNAEQVCVPCWLLALSHKSLGAEATTSAHLRFSRSNYGDSPPRPCFRSIKCEHGWEALDMQASY